MSYKLTFFTVLINKLAQKNATANLRLIAASVKSNTLSRYYLPRVESFRGKYKGQNLKILVTANTIARMPRMMAKTPVTVFMKISIANKAARIRRIVLSREPTFLLKDILFLR